MFEHARHQDLLRLLGQYGHLGIHDIESMLGVSEATVRRDLDKLAQAGSIRRVRGGAALVDDNSSQTRPTIKESTFEARRVQSVEKKRRIARKAVSLCPDDSTIIIDGGSSTFHMAEYLLPRRLKVLTNSFAIAQVLVGKGENTVILPGGAVYTDSSLILDPFETDVFRNYHASMVFMGVNGVGPSGVTNSDPQVIRSERAMIERADQVVILADSSKFMQQGDLVLCDYDRIAVIITDSGISDEAREMVESRDIELLVV